MEIYSGNAFHVIEIDEHAIIGKTLDNNCENGPTPGSMVQIDSNDFHCVHKSPVTKFLNKINIFLHHNNEEPLMEFFHFSFFSFLFTEPKCDAAYLTSASET